VAQLVPRENQRSVAFRLLCICSGLFVPDLLQQELREAFRNGLRLQLHCGIAGNALRGQVPKDYFALLGEDRYTIREAVERSFKDFVAIGHQSLPAERLS
jgi:hypothetical protein